MNHYLEKKIVNELHLACLFRAFSKAVLFTKAPFLFQKAVDTLMLDYDAYMQLFQRVCRKWN